MPKIYENNDNPHEERSLSIADFFNNASQFVDYDMAEKIEAKSSTIMEFQIKNKDAIHIACVIEAGCQYFITTDDELIKKYAGNEIVICNPVNFIKILEDQNE